MYLFGRVDILRPIYDFFNPSLADILRDICRVQLSQLTEIYARIYFLPPLEEIILLVLHFFLFWLGLAFGLYLCLRVCFIFLLKQVENYSVLWPFQKADGKGLDYISDHALDLILIMIRRVLSIILLIFVTGRLG